MFPLALIAFYPCSPPILFWGASLAITAPALLTSANDALPLCWFVLFLVLSAASLRPVSKSKPLLYVGVVHSIAVLSLPTINGRGIGYFGNPNVAASWLSLLIPLALAERQYLCVAVMGLALFYTQSVGGVIAAIVGLIVLAIQNPRFKALVLRHRYPHKRIVQLVALAGILSVFGVIFALAGYRQWWDMRPLQWQLASELFYSSPIIGTGWGSFQPAWIKQSGRAHVHAHNLYLHFLAETGVLGLLGLIILAWWAIKHLDPRALAGISALAVHGLVDATALHPVIAFTAAALFAMPKDDVVHACKISESGRSIIQQSAALLWLLSPVIAAGIARLAF